MILRENTMFGLTHNEDGSPIIRVPRALKVGIGVPRGQALRAFIHPSGEWYIMEGVYKDGRLEERSHKFNSRAEAEDCYIKLRDARDSNKKPVVPDCPYPRKLKYFTFSKPTVNEFGAEIYEPDFDAIEAHGSTPTRIPIIFTNNEPYRAQYQMWSATELRCKGDGINAMRSVLLGTAKDEGWKAAKDAGERYFPIVGGCMQRGCEYAKKKMGPKGPVGPECKPGLTLSFQAANYIMIGSTAAFHTTGWESCRRTFSSLTEIAKLIKTATGHDISGLTAFLTMRPYITHPEGQKPATQYAVHVELPLKAQKSIVAQLRAMFEEEAQPRMLAAAPKQEDDIIDAEEDVTGDAGDDSPIGAAAMAAEFGAADDDTTAPATSTTPAPAAAVGTQAKQEKVAEQLRNRRSASAAGGGGAAPAATQVRQPWSDADSMVRAFNALDRSRVESALRDQGKTAGDLVWNEPLAAIVYAAASGPAPAASATAPTAAAGPAPADDDVF